MKTTSPFSRQLVITLALLTTVSFVGGLVYAMLGSGKAKVHSIEANTFSRSALGHHAFLTLLKQVDAPLLVSRSHTGTRATYDTVLVLLEPSPSLKPTTGEDLTALVRNSHADPIIVVLPKWNSKGVNRKNNTWVKEVHRDRFKAEKVLKSLHIEADIIQGGGHWQSELGTPTFTHPAQLVTGSSLEPIVAGERGFLLARTHALGKTIFLVADPDLINNVGILSGRNAELMLTFFDQTTAGRAMVIDETLHGFSLNEGVWPRLFEFPLALVTAQAVGVFVLLLMAAMRRFGAPLRPAPALGQGRLVLVENTARLLWFGDHTAENLEHYWRVTVQAVRQRLHLPARLDQTETQNWLVRVGQQRGAEDFGVLETAVITMSLTKHDGPHLLALARRIHRWRTAMVDSSEGKTT